MGTDSDGKFFTGIVMFFAAHDKKYVGLQYQAELGYDPVLFLEPERFVANTLSFEDTRATYNIMASFHNRTLNSGHRVQTSLSSESDRVLLQTLTSRTDQGMFTIETLSNSSHRAIVSQMNAGNYAGGSEGAVETALDVLFLLQNGVKNDWVGTRDYWVASFQPLSKGSNRLHANINLAIEGKYHSAGIFEIYKTGNIHAPYHDPTTNPNNGSHACFQSGGTCFRYSWKAGVLKRN